MGKKDYKNGFTLIELLATILVISIVFGIGYYYVQKSIQQSKDRSSVLTSNNVKGAANLYSLEYPDNIVWSASDTNGESTACVSLDELINTGFLKKENVDNINYKYVILTKNDSNTIIKSVFDEGGICYSGSHVPIPTSSYYCSNLSYTGHVIPLTGEAGVALLQHESENFTFSYDKEIKNAGNYEITVTLKDGKTWDDGSTSTKTLVCPVTKAIPVLYLESLIQENGTIGVRDNIGIFSNVDGRLSVKTSNADYVKGSITSPSSSNQADRIKGRDLSTLHISDEQETAENIMENVDSVIDVSVDDSRYLSVDYLASRDTVSYIHVTLVPDSNNYYTATSTFVIEKIVPNSVVVPNTSLCQDDLETSNGKIINLINENMVIDENGNLIDKSKINDENKTNDEDKTDENKNNFMKKGYTLHNTSVSTPGDHVVTAKLNYGYVWRDESGNLLTGSAATSDKTFICHVKEAKNKVNIKLNMNGGTMGTTTSPAIGVGNNGMVTCNGNEVCLSVDWDRENINLPDWDNRTYINIMKEGRHAKDGAEWNTKANGTGKSFNDHDAKLKASDFCDAKNKSCTVTLYVNWISNSYTIRFNGNGNTSGVTNNKGCSYNSDCKLPKNGFKRTGYTFNGWNTRADGKGTSYNDEASVRNLIDSGTINLYAKWKVNVCTVKYNANGGEFTNSNKKESNIQYGKSISDMPNVNAGGYMSAKRDGYTFTSNVAWISSYKKMKFDQNKGYAAATLCPNLVNANQTVTLYVNWWQYQYRSRSYNSCIRKTNTCQYGCGTCGTYSYGYYSPTYIYRTSSPCFYYNNGSTVRNCKVTTATAQGQWSCGCDIYYYSTYSCNCSSCYYGSPSACQGGYNSWSSWSTKKCTVNANTCQRKQVWIKVQ